MYRKLDIVLVLMTMPILVNALKTCMIVLLQSMRKFHKIITPSLLETFPNRLLNKNSSPDCF